MNPETNQGQQEETGFSSRETADELMQMLEERQDDQLTEGAVDQDEETEDKLASQINNSAEEEDTERELSAETRKQLECIDELADLPMTITGGYAEEAALHGEVTREHHDIDFFALRQDADLLSTQLQERGYKVEPKAGPDGRPYKFLISKDGTEGDVVFLDQDQESGTSYLDLQNQDGSSYRVFLDQALNGSQGQLESRSINTVSPLVLIQQREAVYSISRFEPRPQDAVVQAQLINKYYPGRSGDELRPQIQRL